MLSNYVCVREIGGERGRERERGRGERESILGSQEGVHSDCGLIQDEQGRFLQHSHCK